MNPSKVNKVVKKVVRKRTKEEKEIYLLQNELQYYKDLDDRGKVIHNELKPYHTTAVKLFIQITGKKPKDFKFNKDDKAQHRKIEKYNYEVNFQKYCGGLARAYKYLTGKHPQKFTKFVDYEYEEEKDDFITGEIEDQDEKQEEAIEVQLVQDCDIADKNKHKGGSAMYPISFKNKKGETISIIDIARQLLIDNPPDNWEKNFIKKNPKEIIVCDCGCEIQRGGLTRHLKTKKHKNQLKEK
jgi:hypothetical protein